MIIMSAGHTFAGQPVGAAVGTAVVRQILENDLLSNATRNGAFLREKLESLCDLGVVREVRGKGSWLGVELCRDPVTRQPFPELGKALKYTALKNGLIMRIDPTW